MNEHRIVSESVWYDTVLPSGNLYTKRLVERIVNYPPPKGGGLVTDP